MPGRPYLPHQHLSPRILPAQIWKTSPAFSDGPHPHLDSWGWHRRHSVCFLISARHSFWLSAAFPALQPARGLGRIRPAPCPLCGPIHVDSHRRHTEHLGCGPLTILSSLLIDSLLLYPLRGIYPMSSTLIPAAFHTRRRQWHPTPVLLPGESHGQRSLVGCSPWGR